MTMYPNRLGLMIVVPVSGNLHNWEMTLAFHQLHPPMDYNLEYSLIYGPEGVDVKRNKAIETAMSKNAKYVFFLDEDVAAPGHAIKQLIFHLEHWDKAAVAAGIYCHKSDPAFPMVFRGNGIGSYWKWKRGEVFDCSGVGMGCALLRVDAFREIEKPWFKTIDDVSQYEEGIPMGEMWTEDLYACDKLTKAGWMVLADGGITPDHWDFKTGKKWNLPEMSYPNQPLEVKKGEKKIIDLGCGSKKLGEHYQTPEGNVLHVDMREDAEPDFRCDVRKTPFATGEFDIVFSSHTLEHFARNEVEAILDEWIRLMKPEGEFRLNLPNMEWAAQHVMNHEVDNDVMNVFYGAQTYDTNYHKCGFTPQIIEQLLAKRGFTRFVWDFHNYHMFVRAWKVPPKELESSETSLRAHEGIVDVSQKKEEGKNGDLSAVNSTEAVNKIMPDLVEEIKQ